jgi:hypothetical protein
MSPHASTIGERHRVQPATLALALELLGAERKEKVLSRVCVCAAPPLTTYQERVYVRAGARTYTLSDVHGHWQSHLKESHRCPGSSRYQPLSEEPAKACAEALRPQTHYIRFVLWLVQ